MSDCILNRNIFFKLFSITFVNFQVMEKLLSMSSDYWTKFVDCGAGNGQLPTPGGPDGKDVFVFLVFNWVSLLLSA